MNVINCKEISDSVIHKISLLLVNFNLKPSLAIILIGENPASLIYIKRKIKIAKTIGITTNLYNYPENVSQKDISTIILRLSNDNSVSGIILQLPIPNHLDASSLLNQINYKKDVDGLNIYNAGLLHSMSSDFLPEVDVLLNQQRVSDALSINFVKNFFTKNGFIPCTALGSYYLINRILNNNIAGKKVIIFGHSNLVTKPIERLLLLKGCTTTVIHSKSISYELILKDSDIVILATGGKKFLEIHEIKDDAVVIDISTFINSDGNLSGDFIKNIDEISKTNIKYTPVPKGIGPITVAFLMFNLMLSALLRNINVDNCKIK